MEAAKKSHSVYLTIPETADVLRCSSCTIRRAIASRRLACIKPGGKYGHVLVRAVDLETYLQRYRIAAVGENL
jgi:excisionase family DNA binding protein